MFEEECLKKTLVFDGDYLKIRKDFVKLCDGTNGIREFIKARDASAVVALDENENIIMVKQFRYSQKQELLEIPAGGLEEKETPLDGAKRELLEETGYGAESENWQSLAVTVPTAASTQKLHIFLAKEVKKIGPQNLDEGELLQVLKIPYEEVLGKVLKGEILDSKTIVGILKYETLKRAKLEN